MGVETFWSEERVAELTRLWVDEQLSGAEVAKRMGLAHRNAVMGKLHRLGLTRKRGTDAAPCGSAIGDAAGAPASKATKRPPAPGGSGVSDPPSPVPASIPPDEPPPKDGRPAPANGPPLRHPVLHLEARHCRWPYGDPRAQDFRFCCRDRQEGTPYCRAHAETARQAPDRTGRTPSGWRKA